MKKFNVEFKFVFSPLIKGVKGGEYRPLETKDNVFFKKTTAKINLEKMPQTWDKITLLDDTHINTVFEEELGELFKRQEDVRGMFTFSATRHRGWIERTPEKAVHNPHTFWIELACDLGDKRIEDVDAMSSFILAQLVRFGVMDKLRFEQK